MRRQGASRPIEERAFHRWLAGHLQGGGRGRLPLGDDVAALPLGGRRVALLTTDALSEGTHFLAASPPGLIGRAVAAVNLSDLAAKGGAPVAGLLDLLLPRGTPARWAEEVVDGADRMGRQFGAPVVGGDTKPAAGRSVVGTYLGYGRADRLAPRHGARPGDQVVVTGTVGRGGQAAQALADDGPGPRTLGGLLDVRPRVAEGQRLVRWARAMTDTSDGLAAATHLLAAASRVRLVIDPTRIPWDARLTQRLPPGPARQRVGFYGGDYELCATLPPRHVASARRALARLGCPLTPVGVVARGRGAVLHEGAGRPRPMPPPGWDPFRPRPPVAGNEAV